MKNKLIATAVIFVGFWTLITISGPNTDSVSCTNVYVDFGSLDHNKKISECIGSQHSEKAEILFEKAGIKLSGTDKYGLQVVCRVNGLPSPDKESCAVMPPENAYWALIIKQEGPISIAKNWGWAQKGLSDVYLSPGESIGLVFTENGKVRWPS